MNILLINDNPVVSRLLALCTRDEDRVLEEVQGLDTIGHASYDVVFVDEGSYKDEVMNFSDILQTGIKVLLSNADVGINDFDLTIKKPFLPSQIIEVLESIEVDTNEKDEIEKEKSSIFPLSSESEEIVEVIDTAKTQVLDETELEKIKGLLEMEDEITGTNEVLSEEELETRKVEVIKEQLRAEGLEIVGEEEIVDELSASDEIDIFSDDNIEEEVKKNKKSKKKHKKKKSLDFTEEEREQIEDAVQVAIVTLKRKQMKKLLKGKKIEISIALEDTH
ncbi:MAG TPA: hypothetical protein ENK98_07335 [Epsilonproteobacteria bacterium]|nr:hypothetical protein [Campylobacterota bacterium]